MPEQARRGGIPYPLMVKALRETFPGVFDQDDPSDAISKFLSDFPEFESYLDPATRGMEGLTGILDPPAAPPGLPAAVPELVPDPAKPWRTPDWRDTAIGMGLRVVPSLGGALTGAAVGAPAGPVGALIGAAAGGGLFTMAGETLGEKYEIATGTDPDMRVTPGNVAAQGALGALPIGQALRLSKPIDQALRQSVLKRFALSTAEGAVQGGAGTAAEIGTEQGRLLTAPELAVGTAFGGGFGAAFQGGEELVNTVKLLRTARQEGRQTRRHNRVVEAVLEDLQEAATMGGLGPAERRQVMPLLKTLAEQLNPRQAGDLSARVQQLWQQQHQQELRDLSAQFIKDFDVAAQSMPLHERMTAAAEFAKRLAAARADQDLLDQAASMLAAVTTQPEPPLPRGVAGLLPAAPDAPVLQTAGGAPYSAWPRQPEAPVVDEFRVPPAEGRMDRLAPDIAPPVMPPPAVLPPGRPVGPRLAEPPTIPPPIDWRQAQRPKTPEEIRAEALLNRPGAGILVPEFPEPPTWQGTIPGLRQRPKFGEGMVGGTAPPSGPLGAPMHREGLEQLPRVASGEITADEAFLLHLIVADLELSQGYSKGGILRTKGSQVVHALQQLGVRSATAPNAAKAIRAYLAGGRAPSKTQAAALAYVREIAPKFDLEARSFPPNDRVRIEFDAEGKFIDPRRHKPYPGIASAWQALTPEEWATQPRWLVEKYAPEMLSEIEKYAHEIDFDPETLEVRRTAPPEMVAEMAQHDDATLLALYDNVIQYGGAEPGVVAGLMEEIQIRGLREFQQPPLKTEGPGSPGSLPVTRNLLEPPEKPTLSSADAATALATIRKHGFDVELFDERTGKWQVTDTAVSDDRRGRGQTRERRPPAAVTRALEVINQLDEPTVTRLINQDAQPALLPGVRDQEIATPELEAPFALTSEVGKGPTATQGGLFGDEPPAPPPTLGKKSTSKDAPTLPSLFGDERGAVGKVQQNVPGTGRPAKAPRDITLQTSVFDELQALVKGAGGREVSGVLLGHPDGGVTKVVELPNIAEDPATTFHIDPSALAGVMKSARKQGLELLASFHSHPEGGSAAPSKLDLRGSVADVPLVILGASDGEVVDAKVWQPRKGKKGWDEGQLGVIDQPQDPSQPPRGYLNIRRISKRIPKLRSAPGDVPATQRWIAAHRQTFGTEPWFVSAERLLERGQARQAWLEVQTAQLAAEKLARKGIATLDDAKVQQELLGIVDGLTKGGAQDPIGALFALYDGRTQYIPGVGRVVVAPEIPPHLQGKEVWVGPGGLLRPGDRKGKLAGELTDGTLALEITKKLINRFEPEQYLEDFAAGTHTRLFRQIAEDFMVSPSNYKALQALNLPPEEVAAQFEHAVSTSARMLAALSVWKRRNREAIETIEGIYGAAGGEDEPTVDDLIIRGKGNRIIGRLGDLTVDQTFQDVVRPTRAWDRAMLLNDLTKQEANWFRVLEAASRGFMISQLATAQRNLFGAGIRGTVELFDAGVEAALTWGRKPDQSRAAWLRAVERAKAPAMALKDGIWISPWQAARHAEFETLYGAIATAPQNGRQALIALLNDFPEEGAHFLGGVAFGEPTPHRRSKYRVINALISPRLQNFLTMFNRSQEFTVRAAIYTAEMRATLRARGIDPDHVGNLSVQALTERLGGRDRLQDLLYDATSKALDFSFSGDLITRGYGKDDYGNKGSVPAAIISVFNRFPVLRSGYPWPRFNLSAAPRFIWDHSMIGMFLDPLYARMKQRGRYFLGQKAQEHRDTNIPEAQQRVVEAQREMGTAIQGLLGLGRERGTLRRVVTRLEKQAQQGLPGVQTRLAATRQRIDELTQQIEDLQRRRTEAEGRLKGWQSQLATLRDTVKQARGANVPMGWEQLVARNLSGGVLMTAAYLLRSSPSAEGTPWYMLQTEKDEKTGKSIELDFRSAAPFAQFMFVADVIKDVREHTDWAAVWEAAQAGEISPDTIYQFYEGKYTDESAMKEGLNAVLSMSQVAGTTLALADMILEGPTRGLNPTLLAEAIFRTAGSFAARFTIPFVQIKGVTDLVDDDESKARIAEMDTSSWQGLFLPLLQPIGNLPVLGQAIPPTVNQITGQDLDTYAPLLRAVSGITMRERTEIQNVLTEAGMPPSSIYLKESGDRFLDRLMAHHYAQALTKELPYILEEPDWQILDSPALRRDYLQKELPRIKQMALGEVLMDLSEEEVGQAREGREARRRRLRQERLEELMREQGLLPEPPPVEQQEPEPPEAPEMPEISASGPPPAPF